MNRVMETVSVTFGRGHNGPMTNAERQARWRAKHRGPGKRKAVMGPPPGAILAPPAPVARPAPAAPVESHTPAPAEVMTPKELMINHVRYLKPAARLQLARMILDDLARAM